MAAVTAPLVTIASGRLDRRKVLIALALFSAASDVLAAPAPSMAVIAAARVLLGIGVGGFWAMGAGVAARLVPAEAVHRATSLITAGILGGRLRPGRHASPAQRGHPTSPPSAGRMTPQPVDHRGGAPVTAGTPHRRPHPVSGGRSRASVARRDRRVAGFSRGTPSSGGATPR
ncbi:MULTISPECIES: MFS transporter [Streptomyces]|uniref:MFS transporter n=1 Tax=Streptomyces kaempferi TaxID=333725 RepID=A0ABW3X9H3_9ACTN|nr:MFS transporter [Streptomyces sp. RPA4-2]